MGISKRILVNITRNIWKNILFLMLILLIGTVSIVIIATMNSITNIQQNLLSRIPIITTLELAENNQSEIISYPTMELTLEIAASPYVRNHNIAMHTEVFSTEDLLFPGFDLDEARLPRALRNLGFDTPGFWRENPDVKVEPFFLWGIQNTIIDIETGQIELIQGRTFSEDELDSGSLVALVSNQFAKQNTLTIGSTFLLENVIFDMDTIVDNYGHGLVQRHFHNDIYRLAEESLEFTIIGIFDVNHEFIYDRFGGSDTELMSAMSRIGMLHGRIYTPLSVVSDMRHFRYNNRLESNFRPPQLIRDREFEAQFLLYDANHLDTFVTITNEMLPNGWQISDFRSVDANTLVALNSSDEMMTFFLISTLGAGILVLTLVIFLLLKERKREVGIYLALGEKKSEIIKQILLEKLVITFIGLTFSLMIGILFTQELSKTILQQNLVEIQQETISERWENLPNEFLLLDPGRMTLEDVIELSDITFSLGLVIIFVMTGTVVVIIATLIPLVYLVKLEPKKVLM